MAFKVSRLIKPFQTRYRYSSKPTAIEVQWQDFKCASNGYSDLLVRPREQLRSIVMSMSVCVSVCLPGYLRNHTRDLYQSFVHVAYVRGSFLLRYVDDRPHAAYRAASCAIFNSCAAVSTKSVAGSLGKLLSLVGYFARGSGCEVL